MNTASTSENTISGFLKTYADIFGAIVFGIGIGVSIGAFVISNEKSNLFSDNQMLIGQIRSLQGFVKEDSINNENWLNNHIHKVLLNTFVNDQPALTEINYTSPQSSVKSITILAGDSISFKVSYHNSGDFTIFHPLIGFGVIPISNDSLAAIEVLIVGNQIIDKKNVKMVVSPKNRQYFYPLLRSFYLNNKLTILDPTSHKYDYGFPIDNIKPGETFTATYNYLLKITKQH